ncbi:MAG TPA: FtsQ-type POTRA domain-containing protein [Thiotrichales bacterium]|nr:FtsQ-type POTRA domain-containing protein [Thiotrichales bacterium]
MRNRKQTRLSRFARLAMPVIKAWPYLLAGALVTVAAVLLKDLEMQFETVMPITQVRVDGEFEHLDANELKARVLAGVDGGYFTVDLNRTRDRLMQNPWVKTVSVRRRWPAELLVTVTEKQAVAYWNEQALISAEGDVFRPVYIDKTLSLPHMIGPQGQHKKAWLFMNEIYQPLTAMALQVDTLKLDDRRAWQLSLINENFANKSENEPLIIRLGRYNTEARFKRFVEVFSRENSPDLKQIKTIDMRYPNGFAVLKKTQPGENSLMKIINTSVFVAQTDMDTGV